MSFSRIKITSSTGVTLLEVLLGMGVSLLILSSLLMIYFAFEKNKRIRSALSALTDNGQFAMDMLVAEISQAGYLGCAKLTANFPLATPPGIAFTPSNKLIGKEKEMTLIHAGFPPGNLLADMTNQTKLILSNDIQFAKNDWLIISDCTKAEIFKPFSVQQLNKTQQLITASLHYRFAKNAEVSKLIKTKFFLKADHNNTFYLIRENINHHRDKIAAKITDLKFKYGIYSQQFLEVPAAEIVNWASVKSVAIEVAVGVNGFSQTWHGYAVLP